MERSFALAGALVSAAVFAACGGEEDCSLTDSCPNQEPEVTISSPEDGATVIGGVDVTFTGSATDAEDGPIEGDALVWTSDLDGVIGTGTSFTRDDLSGGFHDIVLAATDSEGAEGSDEITLNIGGGPQVDIDAPADQPGGVPASVELGEGIAFSGSAIDDEDGELGGGALVWSSNMDGELGTGETVQADDLTAGMHTVTLTATDSDDNQSKATVLLIVKPPTQPGFQIHIRWSEGVELTSAQQSAVEEAVAKLETVITGDLPDLPQTDFPDVGECGDAAMPNMNEAVDDVIIYLEFVPIDGPNGTVGSAGPCFTRTETALALIGGMRFDTDDLETLETLGLMDDIVLHEMMHVLGFGIFWEEPVDYLEQPSDPNHPDHDETMTDTHFTGPEATARFLAVGGNAYTGGEIVPVENDADEFKTGSLDGHWRESVFETEIMSTAANVPENPLSVVTIGQFEDLGYDVDYDGADPYILDPSPALVEPHAAGGGFAIDLSGDVSRGPLYAVETDGSVRRVR